MATVAEAATLIRSQLDASGYVRGAQQIERANQEIATSTERVAVTSERQQRTLAETGGAFERLRRSLDQTYAQQERFERAQRTLTAGLDRGRVTQAQYNQLLDSAREKYLGLADAATRAGQRTSGALVAANDNAARSTGRLGQVIGQAGFQVQDFAVQVAGGQNAMVAFAQQGSQLLGVFGGFGAVAGAALAVAAVVTQMASGKTNAEQLSESLERQTTQFSAITEEADRYSTALRTQSEQVAQLRQQYQGLSQVQQQGAAARARALETEALANQRRALNETTDTFTRAFAGIDEVIERLNVRIRQGGGTLGRLFGTADVARDVEQLNRLTDSYRRFQEVQSLIEDRGPGISALGGVAGTIDQLVAAAQGLRGTALDTGRNVEDLIKKLLDLRQSGQSADDQLRQAQQILQAYGQTVQGAIDPVTRFAQALGLTAAEAQRFANFSPAALSALTDLRRELEGLQVPAGLEERFVRLRQSLTAGGRPAQQGELEALREGLEAVGGATGQRAIATLEQQVQVEQRVAAARQAGNAVAERRARIDMQVAQFQRENGPQADAARYRTLLEAQAQAQAAGATASRLQPLHQVVQELERSAQAAERAASVAGRGSQAERQATQENRARAEALKVARDNTEGYRAAYERLLPIIQRTDAANDNSRVRNRAEALEREVALMEEEARLAGVPAELRQREIAVLRERQSLLEQAPSATQAEIDRVEELVRRREESKASAERYNATMRELEQIGERAFDRVGEAITQAFVSGEGKAVSFGSVVKGILSEIAQAVLRLAVLNPVLNSLFGTNRATLGSVGGIGGVVSKIGGGTGISTPGGNLGGGGFSFDRLLGADSPLGGIGRLFGGNFNTGISAIDNVIGMPLYTVGDIGAATNSALGGLGAGVYGPATPGAVAGAGANTVSLGGAATGALGILGGAYGIYSGIQTGGLRGVAQGIGGAAGIVSGASALAGGAAAVGSASGAVAGAVGAGAAGVLGAVATVAPYVAIIAAIVASMLPGEKPSNAAAGGTIDLRTGQRRTDDSGKSTPETRGGRDQLLTLMEQQAAQLGAITGVRPVGSVHFEIGARDPSRLHLNGVDMGSAPVGDVNALADLFSRALIDAYRRTDDLDIQQRLIIDKSGDLQTAIDNLGWYQGVYKPFMDNAAMDPNDVQRSNALKALADQVAALEKPFADAAAKAAELGLATTQLTQAQAAAVEDFNQQRLRQQQGIGQGLDVRLLRATGQEVEAALMEQRVQAEQEREVFRQQLLALVPEESSAAWRAEMLAKLDAAQAAERQQLVAQQQEQQRQIEEQRRQAEEQQRLQQEQQRQSASQSAAGAISSLTAYARSLRTGETSPLGFRAQYDLASRDFFGVQDLAASGNVDAIGRLQESASTFLNISRIVNGSGAAFAADNDRVLAAIESVANRGPEQLTQDFMAAQLQSQTASLEAKLDELIDEVAALRLEQRQGNLAPPVGA